MPDIKARREVTLGASVTDNGLREVEAAEMSVNIRLHAHKKRRANTGRIVRRKYGMGRDG